MGARGGNKLSKLMPRNQEIETAIENEGTRGLWIAIRIRNE